MASIADVFFAAYLEDKGLQVQAQKSGDTAGETLGTHMSKGIATAMKVGLGIVSAGAALATKGIVELDDAVADYTADTGASADEAERAGKAINAMSGRNIQPTKEIGKALATVKTNLGLAGDAGEKVTETFLRFARVTKRDASEEVKSFDDILDAYGQTADKIPGIMDKLVKSHQDYGGAIGDDEAALAAMAPQLKAFNLGIDDGISLLNLFKSSGLDAVQIPKALNTAFKNLNGRPLKDFVAELAGIEDPAKRAARSSEIFGSKAGLALANAIRPGMNSLDDFATTTQEAAGSMDRASKAADSAFGTQLQLKLKGFSSWLTEIGRGWGPALTGFASLASLAGAIGLDTFVATFAGKMAQAGKAGGQALIDGIGTTTGAAGTIIGNFFASRLENVLDPTKPTLVGRVVRAVAAKTGFIWGITFGAATKLAEVLAGVLTSLPGAGLVRSAVLASAIKIGTLQGTVMGAAAGVAFRISFLVGLAAIAPELARTAQDLGRQFHDAFLKGTFLDDIGKAWRDFRANAPWPLGQKDAPDWARLGNEVDNGVQTVFSQADTSAALAAQRAGEHAGDEMSGAIIQSLIDAGIPPAVAQTLVAGGPVVADGADAGIHDPIVASAQSARRDVVAIAKKTPEEIAQSLLDGRFDVKAAIEAIHDVQVSTMRKTKEIAAIEGFLTGKKLAKALNDSRPEVRAAAEAQKQAAEDRLFALQHNVGAIALKTGQNYADVLAAQKSKVAGAADLSVDAVERKFLALQGQARQYARNTMSAYAGGLVSMADRVRQSAAQALAGARNVLAASSPPGPASPLHEIDIWGERTIGAWIAGVLTQARAAAHAGAAISEALGSRLAAPSPAAPPDPTVLGSRGLSRATSLADAHAAQGLATAAAAPGERHYHLTVQGDLVAKDPPSVLTTLQRLEAVAGA